MGRFLLVLWLSSLTRMSSKSSGERISAVNVLDTTVGGLFSGSLKRCCKQTNSAGKKVFNRAPSQLHRGPAAALLLSGAVLDDEHSSAGKAQLFKVASIAV